ncbi:MAG: glycogen-binding domain-containing protein, partial [Endomicrobiales bacterium]
MNKKNLLSLIALDLLVMVLAAGFIAFRYHSLTGSPLPAAAPAAPAAPARPSADDAALTALPAEGPEKREGAVITPSSGARNMGFTYRNSRSRRVEIIGDFNEWVPESMAKGSDHQWSITLALPPGEYAYNFVVDGKPIRDPNNARIC